MAGEVGQVGEREGKTQRQSSKTSGLLVSRLCVTHTYVNLEFSLGNLSQQKEVRGDVQMQQRGSGGERRSANAQRAGGRDGRARR